MRTRSKCFSNPATMETERLKIQHYYSEYYGHRLTDLEVVERRLRNYNGNRRSLIFLAGDSSLDNKHWFSETAKSVNGYDTFLDPPRSKKDVTYWLNQMIRDRSLETEYAAINCALEESTIGHRARGHLLKHDIFLRDHVTREDVVVVSVGGNDVALKPSLCTILNLLPLLCCTTNSCLETSTCGSPIPLDDPCCGAGPGLFSNCCACPPGYGYFLHLFGTRVETYVRNLTSKIRPKRILICMIYYLDEQLTGGWADGVLATLGYNTNPERLQILIRRIFEHATKRISVPGTEVVAVPLFAAMNGKDTADYKERVEPSAQGGKKMAELILTGVTTGQAAMDDAFERSKQLSSVSLSLSPPSEDGGKQYSPSSPMMQMDRK